MDDGCWKRCRKSNCVLVATFEKYSIPVHYAVRKGSIIIDNVTACGNKPHHEIEIEYDLQGLGFQESELMLNKMIPETKVEVQAKC